MIAPPAPRSLAESSDVWAPSLVDLELMHQFSAFTSVGMTDNPTHNHLWAAVIPKMAFQHPFLLHGMLSLAALHRRTQATEFQQHALLEIARDHQQMALSDYIPTLGDITSDNCHALFACSQIISAVSYALLQLSKGQNSARDFIQGIVAVFDLLIGSVVIAMEGREWLRQGDLASMLGHGPSLLDWNMMPLSEEPKAALDSLTERLQRMSPPRRSPGSSEPGVTDSYVSALQKLVPLFPRLPEVTPRISTVIGWPVFLDASYIAMLKREEPAALVVLAYYGVTLHKLTHLWWLSGLGARLVQAVTEIVGEEWAPYLIWPRGEVFKNDVVGVM